MTPCRLVFSGFARGLAGLCLLILLMPSPGRADGDEISANQGRVNGFYNGGLGLGSAYQANYSVRFRIWALLQEPVYDVKFTWSFDDRAVVRSAIPAGEDVDWPVNQRIKDLESEALKDFRPYDVRARIDGHPKSDPNYQIYVSWDVGVPGDSGQESYNTPASPKDWGNLFRAAHSGDFLRADQAKAVFKDGFIATGVTLETISWHDAPYQHYIAKTYPRGKRTALARAARRQIRLLGDVQGLPPQAVAALEARLEDRLTEAEVRRRKGDPRFLADLDKLVGKLNAGIPSEMRDGSRNDIYERERAAIAAECKTALEQGAQVPVTSFFNYAGWEQARRAEIDRRGIKEPESVKVVNEPEKEFRLMLFSKPAKKR